MEREEINIQKEILIAKNNNYCCMKSIYIASLGISPDNWIQIPNITQVRPQISLAYISLVHFTHFAWAPCVDSKERRLVGWKKRKEKKKETQEARFRKSIVKR